MAADPMARHYARLTGVERFTLVLEAMARHDEMEVEREDSCPQFTYRAKDAEFRDRMRRVLTMALIVSLNLRSGLAQIRMAGTFRQVCGELAGWPAKAAEIALLYGRAYGRWEAGVTETIELPDKPHLSTELKGSPYLREQLAELRSVMREAMQKVAELVQDGVGETHASNLLEQWEGFGCFCREMLGMDPLVLWRALGLGRSDVAVEVRDSYSNALSDRVKAAG